MIKLLRALAFFALLAFQAAPAIAWIHGAPSAPIVTSGSQFGPNFWVPYTMEYPHVNLWKTADQYSYATGGAGTPQPDELTATGYGIPGKNWVSQGGLATFIPIPIQAENPGNSVLVWLGHDQFSAAPSGVNTTGVSCTGNATNPFGSARCDNSACSNFTASIAPGVGTNGTMTVTAAPTGTGCMIGWGVPVSGAISSFDTMTVVNGNSTTNSSRCSPACTGSGGTGTYSVNISQTLASGTMTLGGRLEFSWNNNLVSYTGSSNAILTQMKVSQIGAGVGTVTQVTNIALFNVNDEAAYQSSHIPCGNGKGCIVGPIFKQRAQQGAFGVLRDLNWGGTQGYNTSSCTTWSSRKPINYVSYGGTEFRNAAPGTETYTVQGQTYTIPKVGQYVNATGSGASGGTISYTTNTYSITLGSGNFVDKQIIIARMPATGDNTSTIRLNGNTAVPLRTPAATTFNGIGLSPPISGETATLVYDATLNVILYFSKQNANQVAGIDCGVPPEVVQEIVAELQMVRWHVPPYLALDAMTDWVTQDSTYQKANYPGGKPFYEASNEPFNCAQYNATYFSAKSVVYNAQDSVAWPSGQFACGGGNGNFPGEAGKVVSTMGQDLNATYGAGNYELSAPTITTYSPIDTRFFPLLTSVNYVNQTMAAQTGYTKTPGYNYATRVSNSNYWNPGIYCGGNSSGDGSCNADAASNAYRGLEAGLAYCYYNYTISSACQSAYASKAAIMTIYMNSSVGTSCGSGTCQSNNLTNVLTYVTNWATQARICFTGSTRPGSCMVNSTSPIAMYEGTYSLTKLAADLNNTFTSASNAASAVLNINSNGCVAGQTITLSALSGGTWATAAGSYTVQSSTTNTCTINLNSTGLGTLSAATLTYTGSQPVINFFRQASYLSPDLATLVGTLYTGLGTAGAINPSMFNLTDNGPLFNSPWLAYGYSLYSGLQMGICTGCSISTTTLTLGGTITGMFRTGDTLYGTNVTGPGKGSSSQTTLGACTPIGANVCGTTSGDTFALNQASTASAQTMTTVAPTYANTLATYQCSPVKQWAGILNYNGNTTCN